MNIVIVNHSDTQGGAAIVAMRLMHAMNALGHDVRMLVVQRGSDDDRVARMGNVFSRKWDFAVERLGIFLCNGRRRDTLFQIDTCSHGHDVSDHPWVQQAQVVMLHWVNQGTLSLHDVELLHRAGKRIVWVMHDMWNCTGVCHHARECDRYTSVCQQCPLLPSEGEDLSTTTQERKAALYGRVPIKFVAVSHWLEQCCRRSSLMRDCDISVIHNAFPADDFDSKRLHYEAIGIPRDAVVMAVGSRRLDDPAKGWDTLVALTRHIAQYRPELASRLHLLLYGAVRDVQALDSLALRYTHLGAVHGTESINRVFRLSDIVLSTSPWETLPTTLIEGMASGAVPVACGTGGHADIVEHRRTGYLAAPGDLNDLADGIEWAMNAHIDREMLHDEVAKRFDAATIAQQYAALCGDQTNTSHTLK